jgi:hypothetical protein
MGLRLSLPVEFDEGVDDDSWRALVELSGLKDEARPCVDEIIALYRQHQHQPRGRQPRHLREFFEKLCDDALRLGAGLKRISEDEELLDGFADAFVRKRDTTKAGRARAKEFLAKTNSHVNSAWYHLSIATILISPGKSGRKTGELLRECLNFLNLIALLFRNRRITLSNDDKSFAIAVMRLADPKLKDATIENVIRDGLKKWDDDARRILRGNIRRRRSAA